jgi:Zn-dependent protease with chaperone function
MWQGLIVAGVAALLVRAFPRLNAATRHAIWWISLVMVVIHPWTPSGVPLAPAFAPGKAAGGLVEAWFFVPMPPHWMVLGGFSLWACLVGWRIWQIVRGITVVASLKRQSRAIDPAKELRLTMWRATGGVGRACELRSSGRPAGACALGFWRPMILLPECLIQSLSDDELDQVVMHEHAHLARYDDWSRLLQCLIEAFLGLHPALWFIGNRIDLERETACDDQVVALTRAPRTYAKCLAHVAGVLMARQEQTPSLVPAATRSAMMLQSRVNRLLDGRRHGRSHFGWLPATASMVVLAAVVVGSNQLPPLVAFGAESDSYTDRELRAFLPVAHGITAPAPVQPIEPASKVAAAKRRSIIPQGPNHVVNAVRMAEEQVDAVGRAGAEEDVAATTVIPPVLLDSTALSGLTHSMPGETDAVFSEPMSNESGDAGSPLAAVGTETARAGRVVAARVQRLGIGVGGWVASKARGIGRAF